MGTDIHGWVEVQRTNAGAEPPFDVQWYGVVKVDWLIDRNYDMFSCLFGVTAFAPFDPVAPNRGLPADISEEAGAHFAVCDDIFTESWLTWSEIKNVDWDVQALDNRPHEYERNLAGDLVYVRKSAPRCSDRLVEGHTWQTADTTFKIENISRRDALSPDWALLCRLMETVAQEYGGDKVRLVVWFDR